MCSLHRNQALKPLGQCVNSQTWLHAEAGFYHNNGYTLNPAGRTMMYYVKVQFHLLPAPKVNRLLSNFAIESLTNTTSVLEFLVRAKAVCEAQYPPEQRQCRI